MSDWKIPAADFPAGAGTKDKFGFAVKYAMMAPGVFGWPAWDYRVMENFTELLARDDQQRGMLDQEEREIMIGCGASLQLFKLTLKHLGSLGRVELFPNLARPELVATLHPGRGTERDDLESQLFAAIRQTTLAPASEHLLDLDATMRALDHAVDGERGWVEFARSQTSRERLKNLALPPRRFEVEDVRVSSRSREPSSRARARFLFEKFSRWREPQLLVKVRASATPNVAPDDHRVTPESAGSFAVLKTRTDDKHGWLAAGLALARLMLQARVLGISCALHQQTLRSAHVRASLRTEIGRKGFVQAILQFGLGGQQTPAAQAPAFGQSTARTILGQS